MERLTRDSAPGTIERPEIGDRPGESLDSGWIVTVYDNDSNTYEQVIMILIVATGCSPEEAYIEAWEIDHLGKSVVHHGAKEECEHAASIISTIGIRVEVTAEG